MKYPLNGRHEANRGNGFLTIYDGSLPSEGESFGYEPKAAVATWKSKVTFEDGAYRTSWPIVDRVAAGKFDNP
ncbi:hypothetical protein PQR62_00465 [Herbaspirillum lusitanum]|jgi:hypothetical protein|uniref:Uncharacterized protein n=1 Tax=Herbaspirillum lusitanum TaxID=213312 RepID=A0ABW9A4D5_9BURK